MCNVQAVALQKCFFCISGLIVSRLLISSDYRLRQLFNRHGGSELLMAMTSYTTGALRKEAAATLLAVTKCNIPNSI